MTAAFTSTPDGGVYSAINDLYLSSKAAVCSVQMSRKALFSTPLQIHRNHLCMFFSSRVSSDSLGDKLPARFTYSSKNSDRHSMDFLGYGGRAASCHGSRFKTAKYMN